MPQAKREIRERSDILSSVAERDPLFQNSPVRGQPKHLLELRARQFPLDRYRIVA